jgi:hypothetical protein
MRNTISQPPVRSRGLTLLGLLLWAIIIVIVVVVGSKVGPSVSEYMACVKGVKAAAAENSPEDARAAFDRYATVGYITTISGKALDITTGRNGGLTVSFSYDKEIPLAGPVSLLIKYQGSSD